MFKPLENLANFGSQLAEAQLSGIIRGTNAAGPTTNDRWTMPRAGTPGSAGRREYGHSPPESRESPLRQASAPLLPTNLGFDERSIKVVPAGATVLDGMGSEKERLVSVDELKNRFFILGLQTGFALQMFVMAVRAFACSTQPSCCTHARPLCPLCRLHSVTTPSPRLSPVLQHDLASLLCIGRHDGDDLPHGRRHRGAQ